MNHFTLITVASSSSIRPSARTTQVNRILAEVCNDITTGSGLILDRTRYDRKRNVRGHYLFSLCRIGREKSFDRNIACYIPSTRIIAVQSSLENNSVTPSFEVLNRLSKTSNLIVTSTGRFSGDIDEEIDRQIKAFL